MDDLRIVFFDEIDDPYKVTLLFHTSLSFAAMPSLLKEIRDNDDRYTPEFGIFAVTKSGTVAAGHLLMKITTETIDGRLEIAGVNAVGTRPDFSRRGIMTSVMKASHRYFLERGLRFGALTSSRRLGATMMYNGLGYVEVAHDILVAKYPNQPRTPAPSEIVVRGFMEDDVADIDNAYKKSVKGSYGFIHRPSNFLKARKYGPSGEIKPGENLRIAQKGNSRELTGYAYWESNPHSSECYEIMAVNAASFHALLADAELRNPEAGIVIWCNGLTDLEMRWLQEANYQTPLEGYGSLLMKDLKGKTDLRKLKRIYGVESGRFRIGLWDGT